MPLPAPDTLTRSHACSSLLTNSCPYAELSVTLHTGSIGGKHERDYIKQTYQAACFEVPEFLNTCGDIRKVPAKNLGVSFKETITDQDLEILGLVKERYKQVPVLIITRGEQELERIYRKLAELAKKGELESRVFVGNTASAAAATGARFAAAASSSQIQRLQEHDPRERDYQHESDAVKVEKKTNWIKLRKSIIENAMEMHTIDGSAKGGPEHVPPLSESARGTPEDPTKLSSSSNYFQITVTDKWGGRGHDFKSEHALANAHGGPLVIATSIPDTREWTQWKGRTARQDKRGQYRVVLSKESELLASETETRKAKLDSLAALKAKLDRGEFEAAIDHLTSSIDSSVGGRLQEFRAKQARGVWLSQLCELYYETHKREIKKPWPFLEEDKLFSKLLVDMNYYESGKEISEAVKEKFPKFDLKGPPLHWDQFPQGFGIPGSSCVQLRPQPNTLMFVIDVSASMSIAETKSDGKKESRIRTVHESIKNIIKESVSGDDKVGLMVFGPSVTVVLEPQTVKDNDVMINTQLDGILEGFEMLLKRFHAGDQEEFRKKHGGTAFFTAVHDACLNFDGPPVWIIALTDGEDNCSSPEDLGKAVNVFQSRHNLNLGLITFIGSDVNDAARSKIEDAVEKLRAAATDESAMGANKARKAIICQASSPEDLRKAFDDIVSAAAPVEGAG